MIEYNIFLNAVHKIALSLPPKDRYVKGWSGKRPHISFKDNPKNYRGLEDKIYGTGFETTYIKPFDSFFCVLDIDDYKDTEYDVLGAVPDSVLESHQAKTQSGGLHIYLLSKSPLELQQDKHVPLDLKAIRKDSYNNGKYGGLIVGNYCYKQKYNSLEGVYNIKKFYTHNNKPLLEVNINEVVEQIYSNLGLEAKKITEYKPNRNYTIYNTVKVGDDKLKRIYEKLKLVFQEHLHNKYMTAWKLNCWTRRLNDSERMVLANWFLEDFGFLMDDTNKFINEFTKRK